MRCCHHADAVWWRFVGNVLLGFRWMPNSSCKWTNRKTIRQLLAVQISMQEWIIWPKAAATGIVNSSCKQKLTNANHLWIWNKGQPIGSFVAQRNTTEKQIALPKVTATHNHKKTQALTQSCSQAIQSLTTKTMAETKDEKHSERHTPTVQKSSG